MATNAWGVPVGGGAWADKVDEGGEEAAPPPPLPTFSEAQAFPSLSAAAAMPQPTKKDKKKGGKAVKMSLSDFQSAAPSTGVFKPRAAFAAGGASRAPLGGGNSFLSNDDAVLKNLPKGPAGYDPEEASNNRLGGGFKEYGGNRGGGFDRERDDRGDREEDMGPSRADMDDNWGATRKFVPSDGPRGGGFGDRRGGGGFDDDRRRDTDMGPSRADGSDNWGRDRRAPPPGDDREAGSLADRYGADRASREPLGPSRADTEDRWSRRGPLPDAPRDSEPLGPSKADTEDRWSKRAPLPAAPDSREPMGPSPADTEDRWSRRTAPPASAGESLGPSPADTEDRWSRRAAPGPAQAEAGGRPKLKLAPRTLPVETPKPAAEGAPKEAEEEKPRAPKANPFGTARPREEILKEQGKDPVKEMLKLEAKAIIRDDTPEEKAMIAEIAELKAKAEAGEDVASALEAKEEAYEKLRLEVNDKLRFARSAKKAEAEKQAAAEAGAGAEVKAAPEATAA